MSGIRLSRRQLLRSGAGVAAVGSGFVPGAMSGITSAQNDGWTASVATWNLGLGADFLSVARGDAETPIPERVGTLYRQVVDSRPQARMNAVAAALARERPDVVGIQEAAIVRRGPRSDGAVDDPDAGTVVADHLADLRDALADRGSPYRVESTVTNADLEFPGRIDGAAADVRVTDRDALLLREDADIAVEGSETGVYDASLTLPVGAGRRVAVPRGYVTARLTIRGRPLAVATTHLEAALEDIRRTQAGELSSVVASLPSPTVVLGDLNSAPDADTRTETAATAGTSTDAGAGPTNAYEALTAEFDDAVAPEAWAGVAEHGAGTCCRPASLRPPDPDGLSRRIDHVLVEGLRASGSRRLGVEPTTPDDTDASVWPSDHAGVLAELVPASDTPTGTTVRSTDRATDAATDSEPPATPTAGTTTATGTPGFGAPAALVALWVAVGAALRRRGGHGGS